MDRENQILNYHLCQENNKLFSFLRASNYQTIILHSLALLFCLLSEFLLKSEIVLDIDINMNFMLNLVPYLMNKFSKT